jgi:hypothetical protein
MHYMHDLKDLLCAELEDYAEKGKKSGKMSAGDFQLIDTVLNSVKNIYKIDKYKEEMEGYSEDGTYMGEGRIYGTSYDDGMHREGGYSYARGRRYAKRDSMGRYSRDGGMMYRGGMRGGYSRDDGKHYMMEQLEEMMEEAEKPAEKEALRRCMDALKRA